MNTNINIDTNIITYLVGGLRLSDLALISENYNRINRINRINSLGVWCAYG